MYATIFNSEVKKFINTDAHVRKLTGDCLFTEGPLWNPAGYYLFSDITANCIYKIDAEGSKEVFFQNSGCAEPNDLLQQDMIGSNGLAYDRNGNLLVCQHGNHAISSFTNGALVPLISEFRGKPLNSPNDLIVHHDGRIFFSDPPYGLKNGELNSLNFQDRAGIYCWRGGELLLVTDQYQYPNGVCLSTDQQKLYACSNKPFEKFV
ncbi:MAG TPA: SMP-30/gluconolactonase/LRE family protein, partial [Chitinophagaceae bacterium]|nr:SMP-30/gluconolactonase/LRE family protein [Chitinophagaceae bacterium]